MRCDNDSLRIFFLIKIWEIGEWLLEQKKSREVRGDDDIQKIRSAMKSETLFFLENLMMKKKCERRKWNFSIFALSEHFFIAVRRHIEFY